MSTDKYEGNLNKVALDEFKTLVAQSADLMPGWKQAVLQLLEGDDIPQDLELLKQLVAGE